jgi:hypothetical protein
VDGATTTTMAIAIAIGVYISAIIAATAAAAVIVFGTAAATATAVTVASNTTINRTSTAARCCFLFHCSKRLMKCLIQPFHFLVAQARH